MHACVYAIRHSCMHTSPQAHIYAYMCTHPSTRTHTGAQTSPPTPENSLPTFKPKGPQS